jgi:integrase
MLSSNIGLTFFLKTPKKKNNIRFIYLRVSVDGVPKETSTKRKWDVSRWDQKTERATGNKEDARMLNQYLDSLHAKINQYKNGLIYNERSVTAQMLMDYLLGKTVSKAKVLEEFQLHNDELAALVKKGEYADGTHERYVTARKHVQEFIQFKYQADDIEFRNLNFEFVKDYEFYLKTVRNCSNNTTLKYIANFKKIVLRAIDRDIIPSDPFKSFKGKKTKTNKKPLTSDELYKLEHHDFSTSRLGVVRDVFIFQCYTGLAYIDAFNLKPCDIKNGIDGEPWIMIDRQKTGSATNVPLLPQALEIISRYKSHPLCLERGSVLPVKSNQKMNAYLKEIGDICGISSELNTHKARRTFGSTVTLANNVPIHIVKELLGHQLVKQTEEYAITEQKSIAKEMTDLRGKLVSKAELTSEISMETITRMEAELNAMKKKLADTRRSC